MKTRAVILIMVTALVLCPVAAFGQGPQHERIAASFLLALGRAASPEELETWGRLGEVALSDLLSRHRDQLRENGAEARGTFERAWRDAFGRAADQGDVKTSGNQRMLYTEWMQQHIESLRARPAEYEQVMHRAYRLVVGRDAYLLEVDYWKQRGTVPFALLVGCIEDWAHRNQPGLMVTTGTPTISVNSEFLQVHRLSPSIAAEVSDATRLVPPDDAPVARAAGRNLVVPGAGGIVTSGHIPMIAVGGTSLVTASSGDR